MALGDFFIRDGKKEAAGKAPAEAPAPVEVKQSAESVDIIDALLHNKEIVTTIDTDYGEFEFKYPSGTDQLRIAHRRAAFLGGHPDASFDNARRISFDTWAALDVLVTKKPDRFKDMVSWADCPDTDLVDLLYERGARFCGDIRQKIRSARPGQPDPAGKPANP